jgi:8-oxo-dGTP diphosphatase
VEPGETPAAALRRELEEELGIEAEIGPQVADYQYTYAGRTPIQLMFFRVTQFTGEVENRDFHDIRWEKRERLAEVDFLEGDVDFVRTLASAG